MIWILCLYRINSQVDFWGHWVLKYLLQPNPSLVGRWSALYTTETQQHWCCPSRSSESCSVIQIMWHVEKFDRSSSVSPQINPCILIFIFLLSYLILFSSALLFTMKKADKNSRFQWGDEADWYFFGMSVFRADHLQVFQRLPLLFRLCC